MFYKQFLKTNFLLLTHSLKIIFCEPNETLFGYNEHLVDNKPLNPSSNRKLRPSFYIYILYVYVFDKVGTKQSSRVTYVKRRTWICNEYCKHICLYTRRGGKLKLHLFCT